MSSPASAQPAVQLGRIAEGGLAPAILAIVERGVRRRPELAARTRVEVELAVAGGYPLVRVVFGEDVILVEDAPAEAPELRVGGELSDLISLLVAPAVAGVPLPVSARGRTAVGLVASRRVRVRGRLSLMRRLLTIIRI